MQPITPAQTSFAPQNELSSPPHKARSAPLIIIPNRLLPPQGNGQQQPVRHVPLIPKAVRPLPPHSADRSNKRHNLGNFEDQPLPKRVKVLESGIDLQGSALNRVSQSITNAGLEIYSPVFTAVSSPVMASNNNPSPLSNPLNSPVENSGGLAGTLGKCFSTGALVSPTSGPAPTRTLSLMEKFEAMALGLKNPLGDILSSTYDWAVVDEEQQLVNQVVMEDLARFKKILSNSPQVNISLATDAVLRKYNLKKMHRLGPYNFFDSPDTSLEQMILLLIQHAKTQKNHDFFKNFAIKIFNDFIHLQRNPKFLLLILSGFHLDDLKAVAEKNEIPHKLIIALHSIIENRDSTIQIKQLALHNFFLLTFFQVSVGKPKSDENPFKEIEPSQDDGNEALQTARAQRWVQIQMTTAFEAVFYGIDAREDAAEIPQKVKEIIALNVLQNTPGLSSIPVPLLLRKKADWVESARSARIETQEKLKSLAVEALVDLGFSA